MLRENRSTRARKAEKDAFCIKTYGLLQRRETISCVIASFPGWLQELIICLFSPVHVFKLLHAAEGNPVDNLVFKAHHQGRGNHVLAVSVIDPVCCIRNVSLPLQF